MSFSFDSHADTGTFIIGHNATKGIYPAGGWAEDGHEHHRVTLHNRANFGVRWQDGPVNREAGEKPNGAFVEDVLDVCMRRLEFYQDSPVACDENVRAIGHVREAIDALLERRGDRRDRGVEGKHVA